jgi:formylglycine-generating enzyme required for sulfatase activity
MAIIAVLLAWGCSSSTSNGAPYKGTFPVIQMDTVHGGTFAMGDSNGAVSAIPVHSVTLGDFSISQTLITQTQYLAVVGGSNPSFFDSGSTRPVEQVSWYSAVLFCNALSKLAGKDTVYIYSDGKLDSTVIIDYSKAGYRLPTEAEYEFACRAGSTTDYYWNMNFPLDSSADTLALDSNAIWFGNSNKITGEVMTRLPNALGLYDMSGNVWEWCNDWYGAYADTAQTNPTGAPYGAFSGGHFRVDRGGAWNSSDASTLCCAYRSYTNPNHRLNDVGFRVVIGARP